MRGLLRRSRWAREEPQEADASRLLAFRGRTLDLEALDWRDTQAAASASSTATTLASAGVTHNRLRRSRSQNPLRLSAFSKRIAIDKAIFYIAANA